MNVVSGSDTQKNGSADPGCRGTGAVLGMCLLLAGCFSAPVYKEVDRAPSGKIDLSSIQNAVPKPEPRSRYGNKNPYTVFGKQYWLLDSSEGYKERGIASWYGSKFHGRRTSSGEIYDVYKMTAAHKSLPLPTYVRVTNLENRRQIIVKVNDRGPFHDDRIIDLSYAAATKLGMAAQGTARVEVEALDPLAYGAKPAVAPRTPARSGPKIAQPSSGAVKQYLQTGAFQNLASAQAMQRQLLGIVEHNVVIHPTDDTPPLYRVRVGPLHSARDVESLQAVLAINDFRMPRLVEESVLSR